MSAEAAERAGGRALAEIGTHGNVAGPDNSLHSQPFNAIRQALAKAGRTVSDAKAGTPGTLPSSPRTG